jgi:hypothetical protein
MINQWKTRNPMGHQWKIMENQLTLIENHWLPDYLRRWVRSQGRAILRLMVIDVDSPEAREGITFPHLFYLSFGKNFRQQLLPFCKCFAHPFGAVYSPWPLPMKITVWTPTIFSGMPQNDQP